jgi:two-component system OmpR family response regulator
VGRGGIVPKILVIEDDHRLARVVEDWLAEDGYQVDLVDTGRGAQERLSNGTYDLLIVDWGLPDIAGVDICKQYRESGGSASILMLTGKGNVADKEQGLDAGADDYLTKPFHPRELSARLRALLRRPREIRDNILQVGDLTLDPEGCRVTKAGKEINLLPKEFALLEFLMRHPNQVFKADVLLDKVWSKESENSPDTVRVHITKLRSKIDSEGEPSIIRTMHRVGYKLEAPERL